MKEEKNILESIIAMFSTAKPSKSPTYQSQGFAQEYQPSSLYSQVYPYRKEAVL